MSARRQERQGPAGRGAGAHPAGHRRRPAAPRGLPGAGRAHRRARTCARFIRAVVQADAYGVSIADVLRTQAQEMRLKRRQRAEEKAMQIPVKVIFPLILCILPTLFIVLLGPAVMDIVAAFSGSSTVGQRDRPVWDRRWVGGIDAADRTASHGRHEGARRPRRVANVTEENIETRAQLLPEEQAAGGSDDPGGAGGGDPRRVRGAHDPRGRGRRAGRAPAVVGHRGPALTRARAPGPAALVGPRLARPRQPRAGAEPHRGRPARDGRRGDARRRR